MTSKFALVIANTEYQDTSFAKLAAPGNDAEEFAKVLGKLATFDSVEVLLNEGEGKTRRSIARFFADRKRDDLLLLYFSGHGVRNEQGQLFLAANDTEINILEASGISSDFVTSAMNHSRSQRQLLILDCCNSGAFAYGSKSGYGVGKSMGIASAFEGNGFGRVVLTATDATQFAWEGDRVIGDTQKSVFTHFLIEGLKGEADLNGDGRIDVDELYDYAYEEVVRRTPKQTPGKWSYRQQGDLILRENLTVRDVKPFPLPADLEELLSHPNSSVRKAGLQDLVSLLEGKHLGLAHAAQEKLYEIVASDDSASLRKTAGDVLVAHGLPFDQNDKGPEPPIIQPDLKALESEAIRFELMGDFWNALQTYYRIKGIDPLFPRVDIKINELEKELERQKLKPAVKFPKAEPKKSPAKGKTFLYFFTGASAGLLLLLLCGLGCAFLWNRFVVAPAAMTPTYTVTSTATSPSPTGTAIPTLTPVPPTPTPGIHLSGNVWNSELNEPHKFDPYVIPNSKTVMNFALEADVRIHDSVSSLYGLMLRVQSNEKQMYNFKITPDGELVFELWKDSDVVDLLGPKSSSFIKQGSGETNRLKVVAVGSRFVLSINGMEVGMVTDDTYTSGKVGLISCTCNGSSGTSATFSNVILTILP